MIYVGDALGKLAQDACIADRGLGVGA